MKSTENPLVQVFLGSASDREMAEHTRERLDQFGIPYQITVSSAHRSPERTSRLAASAERRGVKVIIAMAGGAAHLAGVIAAHTVIPVIAVPLASTPLAGFDALLASVQMPPGVPVATVAVGRFGAENAAILAAQILALNDPAIRQKLHEFKAELVRKVEESDRQSE
ncbi:MAG: 5-(carboxyamino)imidazole ribonucleotide mutase [Candidatus Binataceae bacterium]|jgi:phosphoribosylaminoimidazole carboxylase PurE protein